MMKDRSKRIQFLKLEILELEDEIFVAESNKKLAFAHRLKLILEKKNDLLESWILNS